MTTLTEYLSTLDAPGHVQAGVTRPSTQEAMAFSALPDPMRAAYVSALEQGKRPRAANFAQDRMDPGNVLAAARTAGGGPMIQNPFAQVYAQHQRMAVSPPMWSGGDPNTVGMPQPPPAPPPAPSPWQNQGSSPFDAMYASLQSQGQDDGGSPPPPAASGGPSVAYTLPNGDQVMTDGRLVQASLDQQMGMGMTDPGGMAANQAHWQNQRQAAPAPPPPAPSAPPSGGGFMGMGPAWGAPPQPGQAPPGQAPMQTAAMDPYAAAAQRARTQQANYLALPSAPPPPISTPAFRPGTPINPLATPPAWGVKVTKPAPLPVGWGAGGTEGQATIGPAQTGRQAQLPASMYGARPVNGSTIFGSSPTGALGR